MEHLVIRFGSNPAVPCKFDLDFALGLDKKTWDGLQEIFDALADVYDILGDNYNLDRLRELLEADRAGRCEIVPEVMYQVDSSGRVYPLQIRKIIYDAGVIVFDKNAIGKRVFQTREAVEAALKERCGDEG